MTDYDLTEDWEANAYEITTFEDEAQAQVAIDELQPDGHIYHLAHGEAGAPSYEIVDLDEDDGPDCLPATGEEFYKFEEIEADDLPEGAQEILDGLNVEYASSGDDYDVYTGEAEIEGITYMIVFCPTTVALQRNADDLGGIDWDHAAYFEAVE